ncbi:MAG TPA: ABC transporter permease [Bacteroidetes bacterium]|nr:ABC transporter permease [Bacteroidota bacterium]
MAWHSHCGWQGKLVTMLQNYLKMAFRSLRKNKTYAFINIVGLSVGIAAVLLIFRMLTYELSFNKNFDNYGRTVRVVSGQESKEGGKEYGVCIPLPAMKEMETVPQFEAMARVREVWAAITVPGADSAVPKRKFQIGNDGTAFFTETPFFEIFNFGWLAGDPKTALSDPNSIVLTRTWAEKCFDDWPSAMGKTVLLDNITPVTVRGVMEDLPSNCDFNFPYLISYQTVENNGDLFMFGGGWGSCSSNNQVYALLKNAGQAGAANASLARVGEEEYTDEVSGKRERYHIVQPLSDLHYNEDMSNSGDHRISKSRLRVLGFIGILILIMACFNFINLATAQATLRAKEVGVRKTLGSGRGELVSQFMTETGMVVLVAVLLGANLAAFASPLLKYVSDVPGSLPFMTDPVVVAFLVVIALVVTLLAGLYPALAMAGFRPVEALKTDVHKKAFAGATLRKSLVVLQFAIAQALIVGAMITILQLDYIGSRDLGFSKDLVYVFGFNSDSLTIARQSALRQGLLQIPEVKAVSFNSDVPLSGNTWSSNFRYGTRPQDEEFHIESKFCDENYLETFGLHLAAGEWLHPSDTMREAVVNMTLLRKLGVDDPKEALRQNLSMHGRDLRIVGVVEDFHTHSLRNEHQPLMMSTLKKYYWNAGVKINSGDLPGTIAAIQKAYDQVLPEQVFMGNFLDEDIAGFYEDDSRLASTCKGFGLLAILISCLGLFGLATHTVAQRIKEIGIRKVLGATVGSIVGLLSKDFLILVSIAFVIAAPVAWYAMNSWLNDFAFRIDIEWWVFAIAGFGALAVAFAAMSYQSIRAAIANPVQSLRSE